MIIYNHKKEFLGLEGADLKALGLSSLMELQAEVNDFADLFVKTPGYIHNFKHVHWIDFVATADSIDENRVIIYVKGKSYKANIELKPLYLADAPDKRAYGVVLNALRELTKEEKSRISSDLATSAATLTSTPTFDKPENDSIVSQGDEHFESENEDIYAPPKIEENEDEAIELGLDFDDEPQTSKSEESYEDDLLDIEIPQETPHQEQTTQPQQPIVIERDEDDPFQDYRYDPEFAAKELGLPVDLVEEFIQDFIAQSNEFRPQLYEALENGRIDQLRMLSHKLKGVAANLRIEDALDALVIINTSDDIDLVKYKLNYYYNVIMKKLNNEEIVFTPKNDAAPLEDATLAQTPKEIKAQSSNDENIETIDAVEPIKTEDELPIDEGDNTPKETKALQLEDSEKKEEIELPEEEDFDLDFDLDSFDSNEGKDNDIEDKDIEIEDIEPISFEEGESEEVDSSTETPSTQVDTHIEIDKEKIARELGLDTDTYNELLKDFVSDTIADIAKLQDAVAQNDEAMLKRYALRLKGMSDNMHLKELSNDFETLFKSSDDKAALLESIKQKIDSISGVV